MKKQVYTEIVINAPTHAVWAVLADTEHYGDWNSFITRIEGALEPCGRLTIELALTPERKFTFKPRLIRVFEERELRWIGRLGVAGLFDGEHSLTIEPDENETTRFIQQETFSGILVPFIWFKLKHQLEPAFTKMNRELKARVESRNDG